MSRNKYPGPEMNRFESENAKALQEARAEQRRLNAARKKSGVPDRTFIGGGTGVIVCRR